MAMRVNNNIIALNTQRSISRAGGGAKRQLERLSSGLRVNRAMDDASGLVVSEGLRSEAIKLNQNVRNAQQGSDMLQVAEGSLHPSPNPRGMSKGVSRSLGSDLGRWGDDRRSVAWKTA